jgi:phage protein U/ElaB/YqjD/DUF883 family membrane-anchored ribosome-binding protein
MYAQLGNIPIQLIMPTGMDSSQAYNYAEHPVIEGKPLLQYIGDGLETFNIQIRFHVSYCTPGLELKRLRAEAAKHQALPLLFANGTYKGRYVITGIDVTTEITADDGSLMSVDVKTTLKEWVDTDPLGSKQAAQQKIAPGLQEKGPVGKITQIKGQQTVIAAGQIKASAGQINQFAKKLQTLADKLKAGYADISAQAKDAASQIRESVAPMVQQAQAMAAGAKDAAAQVQAQATAISGLASNITRITSGLPYPASIIGNRIAGVNRQISAHTTKTITLSQLAQGNANEAGTRAQMITRMLPGGK